MHQLMSVRKMAVAVRLLDSFTGEIPEQDNLWVRMADGARPVKKADGYYIFWDNGEVKRTLLVDGKGYERITEVLDLEELEKKRQPACCLWLVPDRTYGYPAGISLAEFEGKPGEMRHFPMEQSVGCINLLEAYPLDIHNPGLICLCVPDDMELEGRHLYIRGCDGAEEQFTVWSAKNRAMGIYELREPLRHVYGPYQSEVLLTLPARADDEGHFVVPVDR